MDQPVFNTKTPINHHKNTLLLPLIFFDHMDRNSILGTILIVLIFIGYVYVTTPSPEEAAATKRKQDSIAMANKAAEKKPIASQPASAPADTLKQGNDSNARAAEFGQFANIANGTERFVQLENENLLVKVSTKGGKVYSVTLKKYQKSGKTGPVTLFEGEDNDFSVGFNTPDNKNIQTSSLFFVPNKEKLNVSGNQKDSLTFTAESSPGKSITFLYTLEGKGHQMGCKLISSGLDQAIASNLNYFTLNWNTSLLKQEAHISSEREKSTLYYKTLDNVENLNEREDEKKEITEKPYWIACKQQYFNAVLMAEKGFENGGSLEIRTPKSDSNKVKEYMATVYIPFGHKAQESFNMTFFFGPNHVQTLEQVGQDLEKIVPLGWSILRWVNRYVVIPIFNWLDDFHLSYGIIILLLTIIIKMVLFPLVYRSYMSTAKMRILKPEIDQIKEKTKGDMQQQQQETMALYRKAGVNPLGGCFPLLLQMPILLAMFQFFPNAFELRQQSFLWAEDLSTYDSVWNFGFVPFINWVYGDHVSLFTLLMTISSLVFTLMNNQISGATGQMKYLGYIMPILFLGFFNNYASGLTWYYFLSNCITIIQQLLIRRFVDENALHAKIQENKKKPLKKSSFQMKMEEMAKKRGIDPNSLNKKK